MSETADACMCRDIHPCATLTRIYVENVLGLSPLVVPRGDTAGAKRTQVGIRVSLDDTGTLLFLPSLEPAHPTHHAPLVYVDGPETTDIVLYGEAGTLLHPPPLQLSSAATSTSVGPPPLNVRVARITPAPRAPRPDDPTPRQPPVHLFGGTTFSELGKQKRIVPRSSMDQDKGKGKDKEKEDHVLRRAREVMLHLPRSHVNGRGKHKHKSAGQCEGDFKVPELPAKVRQKQGGAGTDVFGAVELPEPQSQSSAHGKGKGKVAVVEDDNANTNSIEDANKLVRDAFLVWMHADARILPRC